MLAERLPGLLPDLEVEAALQSAAVASVVGRSVFDAQSFRLDLRPKFEAPHHSSSMAAIVGGGLKTPRPGSISLAHNGVLFLDEAPEFQTPVLDALRQPLESGEIRLHRSAGTAVFPARFQLILAANPCPCGKAFAPQGCQCSAVSRARYGQKLSGPLLDRIDIRLVIQPVSALSLQLLEEANAKPPTTSAQARSRILSARLAAKNRLSSTPWESNSQVPANYLRAKLRLPKSVTSALDLALMRGRISMRGYDRCLRLAWTIADLAGNESPNSDDMALAVALRGNDVPLGGAI
jgi:magnesium chelatase family protein